MISSYENLSKEELVSACRQLTEKCLESEKTISEYQSKIVRFEAELAQLKKLIFGSRSERFVPAVNPQQATLELDLDIPSDKAKKNYQSISYLRKQAKKNQTISTQRMALPADLPRVEIVIEPKEDVAGCVKIGEEITEELELEPARFYVNKYVRPKYVKTIKPAAGEEGQQEGTKIIIGELPCRPIEKGIPGPGFLATIITDKYMDHLPLYRQMQRYERLGVQLNDSTFSQWVQAAANLLEPLYDELKKQTLSGSYLQADETPIKVLDRDKQGTTHRGYYWVYHNPHKKLVLFDYQRGRGRDGPKEVLKEYKGFLQTDGYGVYDDFDKGNIRVLNCWAHARRMFDEALGNDGERASYALGEIQKLYAAERSAREGHLSHEQRLSLRQRETTPVLEQLHRWLKENIVQTTPQSLIGKAIAYALARWDKLCLYTQHGELEIDNNLVENAIRPVALGRKNYLFAGSHRAAQRAAMLYSLLASCKNNGTEPQAWLKNILRILPDYKANRLHELLPQAQMAAAAGS